MHNITVQIHSLLRSTCLLVISTATLCLSAGALRAHADDQQPAPRRPSAMSSGWKVDELAHSRGVVFAHELKDVPGKDLVVVRLDFSPNGVQRTKSGARCTAHRHPGSVWVYVTSGTVRLGIAGQPVHVVHTGESFYEPKGAVHVVAESASATEPASAIAVMIVPDGAALLTPVACAKQ